VKKAKKSRFVRGPQLVGAGPQIGWYQGTPIRDWVQTDDGRVLHFIGVTGAVVSLARLKLGQVVLAPGLIYQ